MRTTLVIYDDTLLAARAIARQRKQTLGKVVSALARSSLVRPASAAFRKGIMLLPVRRPGAVVTSEIVKSLRDEGV